MSEARQGIYRTQDEAFRQADMARSAHGTWPGVISYRDGSFGLTYDPRGDEFRPRQPKITEEDQ